jgi:hypothetical protein
MSKLRLALTFLLSIWLIGCMPVMQPVQARAFISELGAKWLDISIGPDTVDWFNRRAQPQDIARIDHLEMLNLLNEIAVGQRLVGCQYTMRCDWL